MLRHVKLIAEKLLNLPSKWLSAREFQLQTFTKFNERPVEFGFVFKNIGEIYPRTRHYHVIDDDIASTALTDSYDLVTCISVLEHIQKSDDAVRNMLSLLNPDGHLILTCPYTEESYVRNVYDLPESSAGQEASYITQSFSRAELNRWIEESDATIVKQEYWQFWQGDYWTVGEQIIPPKKVSSEEKHQLSCILIKKGERTVSKN